MNITIVTHKLRLRSLGNTITRKKKNVLKDYPVMQIFTYWKSWTKGSTITKKAIVIYPVVTTAWRIWSLPGGCAGLSALSCQAAHRRPEEGPRGGIGGCCSLKARQGVGVDLQLRPLSAGSTGASQGAPRDLSSVWQCRATVGATNLSAHP